MNLLNMLLVGATGIMLAGILVLLIAAAVMITWWEATEEGSHAHENAKR